MRLHWPYFLGFDGAHNEQSIVVRLLQGACKSASILILQGELDWPVIELAHV